MREARKDLILGTAVHCSVEQIKPFIISAKKHCPQAHIALVVAPDEEQSLIDFLNDHQIQIIYFVSQFFILTRIHNTRFIKYLEFLMENSFRSVFLTDVTDVVFQGDIFFENLQGLHVFQEDAKHFCGTEPHNAWWIKNNYGDTIRQQMEGSPIFCSGTILGDHKSIVQFLTRLLQERSPQKFIQLGGKEDDQGPFNYLIHTQQIQCTKHSNGTLVGTVCLTDDADIQVKNNLIETYRKIPKVVHQYVKKPMLVDLVKHLYL